MVKFLKSLVFLLVATGWCCSGLKAQDSTSILTDSLRVLYFYNNFETQGPDFVYAIDTSVEFVQRYDYTYKVNNYYATLGNPGSAHTSLYYKPQISSGFNLGLNSFNQHWFYNDSIKYFWTGRPYTHIHFIQGAKKEQNLRIDHAQNFAGFLTTGIHFRYVNSPGHYRNQNNDDKNFAFTARFHSRNYRYVVLANYIHNKVRVEENGGIVYDTVFESNVITSRDGILVNLNGAENSIIENSYYVKQLFKLSNRNRFFTDTTTNKSFFNNLNPGNISHAFRLSKLRMLYQEPTDDFNGGFYPFTYDSSKATYDSTYLYQIENQLSWTNADNAKNKLLTFNFALKHTYIEYTVDSAKSTYNQLIPFGEINMKVSNKFRLYGYADFVTGNTNVGDFNIHGKLTYGTRFGVLEYSLQNALVDPGRLYQYYRSNHFRWENDFNKQFFVINSFSYHYKTFRANLNLMAIENFTFMNEAAVPDQLGKNLQVLQANVANKFKAGNWRLYANLMYQNASSNNGLRVPEFTGDASLYFINALFKQAAILQTGVDVFYNTPYLAYAYMPATRSFYIQNEKELGNYFYLDVFLNLQIKRARLTLKYQNLGYLFNDFRYYTVPSYPMKDGGIKFGVSWMFYD